MDVDLLQLDVLKASGWGFAMILAVSAHGWSTNAATRISANKWSAMQRVLHIKKVTQCEMLEDFGVFLVLADNVFLHHSSNLSSSEPYYQVLFAYHIEALVPSNPSMAQSLQKMNTIVHKDVQFFRTGRLNGRTLLVFIKKDGVGYFRTVEITSHMCNPSQTAYSMWWNPSWTKLTRKTRPQVA
jgi:hypothetical protein